jgi:hypothetical protein
MRGWLQQKGAGLKMCQQQGMQHGQQHGQQQAGARQAAPVPSKLSRWASPPSTLCSTQVQPLQQGHEAAGAAAGKAANIPWEAVG